MKKFTSITDVNDLKSLLALAHELKSNPFENSNAGKNKTLGLLFFNPSLRTRLSTQKAAMNLGMNVIVMNLNNDGWSIEFGDGTVMNQGTQEHIKEINEHFKVLISRVLVVHVPCLKKHQKYVTLHIPHKYSEAMSHSTFLVRMILFQL